jgi:biotin carboxyl carrier protein
MALAVHQFMKHRRRLLTRSPVLAKRTYLIDGQSFDVEVLPAASGERAVLVNGKRYGVQQAAAAVPAETSSPGARGQVAAPRAVRPAPGDVRAPMAGRVVHVHAQKGQSVSAGAPLIVLDAMKMENIIHAPRAGRVEEIAIGIGNTVLQGALLVRLA